MAFQAILCLCYDKEPTFSDLNRCKELMATIEEMPKVTPGSQNYLDLISLCLQKPDFSLKNDELQILISYLNNLIELGLPSAFSLTNNFISSSSNFDVSLNLLKKSSKLMSILLSEGQSDRHFAMAFRSLWANFVKKSPREKTAMDEAKSLVMLMEAVSDLQDAKDNKPVLLGQGCKTFFIRRK